MSNNSKKVEEAIKTLLADVQDMAGKYEGSNHSQELRYFLREIQKELNRRQRAFGTKRLFVVTIGALKAGKSTLINALTGHRASPDGTGAETTKKCSIIMSADDEHPEGITLYRYGKEASPEMDETALRDTCQKATRSLIDYFKEIRDWDENGEFLKRFYPLHENRIDPSCDNLDYILTSSDFSGLQDFRDFMLAEIRIKTDPNDKHSVLSQNVAIIDMPGLDGLLAGVDSNEVNPAGNPINFLPLYSHLFLLVQSSISGLNRTTADKLKEWKAEKKSTPVFLVFNIINSKSEWHTKDSIDDDNKKRQENASKEMEQQQVRCRAFYTVNAAKAWESCHPEIYKDQYWDKEKNITEDQLREESKIEFLIEALRKVFDEQKDRIIQEDAVNGVSNALKKFLENAAELEKNAKDKRIRLNDERVFWEKIMNCFDACNKEYNRASIEASFEKNWEGQANEVKNWVENQKENWKKFPWDDDENGQNIDDKMNKLVKYIQGSTQKAHKEQGFLNVLNNMMKDSFCNDFLNNFRSKLDNLKEDNPQYGDEIDSIKEEIRSFEQWEDSRPKMKDMFSQPDPFVYQKQKKLPRLSLRWIPLYKKRLNKYVKDLIEGFAEYYYGGIATQKKSVLQSFCIKLNPDDDTCLFNQRVNEVRKKLECETGDKIKKINAAFDKYEEIRMLIPDLTDKIKALNEICIDFQNKISI